MKIIELKPCANCGGKLGPVWNVIRISTAICDQRALREVAGVSTMLGSLALAEVMVPNADVVKILGDENPSMMTEIHVCQDCYLMKSGPLVEWVENVEHSDERSR